MCPMSGKLLLGWGGNSAGYVGTLILMIYYLLLYNQWHFDIYFYLWFLYHFYVMVIKIIHSGPIPAIHIGEQIWL